MKLDDIIFDEDVAHAHIHLGIHERQLIFLRKSDCLGCAVLLCLVVCTCLDTCVSAITEGSHGSVCLCVSAITEGSHVSVHVCC